MSFPLLRGPIRVYELIFYASLALPGLYLLGQISDAETRGVLTQAGGWSLLAFLSAFLLIPALSSRFMLRGLKGKDMGRRGTPLESVEIPSAVGLVCAVVFLVCVISTQLWWAKGRGSSAGNNDFLAWYSAALLSICFMTLLGFADDVLDLPWRYKFILPVFASLPLLAMYTGTSAIKLPSMLGSLLVQRGSLTWLGGLLDPLLVTIDTAAYGHIVDLGAWYLVYMGLLGVFATNAINIYAGINGLEAGQAAVISIAVITANLTELAQGRNEAHLFSALLGMPFLAVNLAVLYHNTYPAAVFVGDTFCYFAGMTLAVHGILGHMSKTLLIFFAPQVFNFVYSLPQIAKVYPCPRHRLPDFDPVTGLLKPSTFEVPLARTGSKAPQASPAVAAAATTTITPATEGGSGKGRSSSSGPKRRKSSSTPTAAVAGAEGSAAVASPRRYDNFTLINLVLRITGPMHERTTTNVLLLLQAVCCAVGLYIRHLYLIG